MTTRKTKKPTTEETNYEPTAQERTAMANFLAGCGANSTVRIKISEIKGVRSIGLDHPDRVIGYALLAEALGTADLDFLNGILKQLANAGSQGSEIDEAGTNFMLSVIKGIEPRDQIETMLAAQMAAVHMASMTFTRRLAHVEYIQHQDSAERAFNKLARTFTTQMEALKRYRTGGEQKVTVQHVSVSEGGQAIVGNVTQNPAGAGADKVDASPPALVDAKTAPMPVVQGKEPAPVSVRHKLNK